MSRKFELSHDVLARTVYEKSSQEDRMLLHLESFVRERYHYYKESGVYLIDKDLVRLLPYVDRLSLTEEEHAFITTSQRRARKNRNRRMVMLFATVFLPVTLGLAIFASYEASQANKQRQEALDAKAEADSARDTANHQKSLALEEKSRALIAREEADSARWIADEKSAQLDRKNDTLETQTIRLDSALRVNRELNAKISATNKFLVNRLDRTQNTLKNTTQTLQQSIDNTNARLRGFQADEMYRLGNTIDGFNLAASAYQLSPNVKAQQVLFQAFRDYQNYGMAMFRPLDIKQKMLVQQQVVMASAPFELSPIDIDTLPNKSVSTLPGRRPYIRPNTSHYWQFQESILGVAKLSNKKEDQLLVLLPEALVLLNSNDFKETRRFPIPTGTAVKLSASSHQPEGLIFLDNGKALFYRVKGGDINFSERAIDVDAVKKVIWGLESTDDFMVRSKNGSLVSWTDRGTLIPMPQPSFAVSEPSNGSYWQLNTNGELVLYRREIATSVKFPIKAPKRYWANTEISTNRTGDHVLMWIKGHSLKLADKEEKDRGWVMRDSIQFRAGYSDNLIALDFIPTLNGIAALTLERMLFIYNMRGSNIRNIVLPNEEQVFDLDFADDALRFVANSENKVYLCDVSGAVLQTYTRYPVDQETPSMGLEQPMAFLAEKGKALIITHFNNAIERVAPIDAQDVIDYFYTRSIVKPFTKEEELNYNISN